MPYISDNAMQTLDLFMTSIGRKRAWDVLKSKLGSGTGGTCEDDGCVEAIKQTKINKANIAANATNITKNADNIATNITNITKNADDIADLKDQLDRANPDDVDDWFND